MNSEDAAACIQAALLMPKVGRKTVRKIFEDLPEEVSDRSSFRDHLVRIGGSFPRVPSTTEEEVRKLFEEADELIAKTTKYEKGSVLSMFDFPDRLKRMDDPPVLLHCLGDRSLLEGKSAAVIGTRNPTDYGREAALAFGRLLAEKGRTVVSGLALGCDTEGHLGCLEAGGGTVAVMAHGLDTVYPPENRDLAERIVARRGLLLSEYPMGVSGRRNFFVERDRIQAALSDLVVVVETGLKGGTLHTVGFAEKGGVPVHALDHPEEYREEDQALGNRNLIETGRAAPISATPESIDSATTPETQPSARKESETDFEASDRPAGISSPQSIDFMSDLFHAEGEAPSVKEFDLEDAELTFVSPAFKKGQSDHFLSELINSTDWRQDTIKFYGKVHDIPRLTAWFGDPGKNYTYSNIEMNPTPWTPMIREIKDKVEEHAGTTFNSLLINYYRNGSDKVSWHSDDERELGQNPTIASVSLGAERKFKLRHKTKDLKEDVLLKHGSLLIMGGPMQHHWEHEIPKTAKPIGPRVNLTFRKVE